VTFSLVFGSEDVGLSLGSSGESEKEIGAGGRCGEQEGLKSVVLVWVNISWVGKGSQCIRTGQGQLLYVKVFSQSLSW